MVHRAGEWSGESCELAPPHFTARDLEGWWRGHVLRAEWGETTLGKGRIFLLWPSCPVCSCVNPPPCSEHLLAVQASSVSLFLIRPWWFYPFEFVWCIYEFVLISRVHSVASFLLNILVGYLYPVWPFPFKWVPCLTLRFYSRWAGTPACYSIFG